MAKGRILQDYGDGFYKVEVDVNRTYTVSMMERINAKITHVESEITIAEAELIDLQYAYSNINDQNTYSISLLKAAIENIQDEQIAYYTGVLTTQNQELQVLKDELRALTSLPEELQNPVAIANKEAEIAAKEAQIKTTKDTLKTYEDQIKDKQKEIEQEQKEIDDALLAVTVKEDQIATMKSELLALQKRYALLQRLADITNWQTYAWCCDVTEGLSGTVPLIEIAQEIRSQNIILNIPPGYEDGAGLPAYTIPDYGEFSPFISLPVADGLRNFLAMPAIQKWAPTYRHGKLIGIDYEANTGTVLLDYTSSSIQALPINQSNTLYNVPIEYMFCDAGAFEEDDEVVVEFINRKWSTPKVIGFKENPQPCGWEEPWNGPEITWKYPWSYQYGFWGGTGTQATRTITNGIMTMSFPATDESSGALGQFHYLQYTPYPDYVTKNVNAIKFNCAATIDCYSGASYTFEYRLVVVGWDTTETTLLSYIMKVVYNGYWPHIGCEGFDYDETDFSLVGSGNTTVWWLPGGPYPYRNYSRLVDNDKDTFMIVPEAMKTVLAVGLEMDVDWIGGAAYNQPSTIAGGSLSCDLIALA